jgi:hypothetical protein
MMADTHKLMKLGIEPAMRQQLADYCGGIDLQQRKMPIRWNGEGTGSSSWLRFTRSFQDEMERSDTSRGRLGTGTLVIT